MNKNVIVVEEVAEGTTVKCAGCGKEMTVANEVATKLNENDELAFCKECMARQLTDNDSISEGSAEAADTIKTALGN